MNIEYKGGMRFDVDVRGHKMIVDQPPEMKGKDEGPTPADLFIASLGTCIGVYVHWYCDKHNINHEGMKINLVWAKATTPPARIDMVEVNIDLPDGCPQEHKKGLINQAEKCLIHQTIKHEPEININV